MRRITLWALSTLTTLVLLFSYHTSTSSQGGGAPGRSPRDRPRGRPVAPRSRHLLGRSAARPGAGRLGSSSTGSGSSAPAAKSYDGGTAQTEWGPVQVRITVQDGKITASKAVVYPTGNGRDHEINSYALPVLNQEVVQAQSANIDMVSGATVTSDGYVRSLQSAIDQAHLSRSLVATRERRAFVEQVMGMPVSIHVRGAVDHDGVTTEVAQAFGVLRRVDAVFSTWRGDSDLMRVPARRAA